MSVEPVRQTRITKSTPRRRTVDVSVCVANWNCRELLRDCLRSLGSRRQGLRVEVIVVDNGSTDGAAEMVARDFPGVQLVQNVENRGFAAANNQAAALARGRYLFFLNNDTVVPRNALQKMRDYLRRHSDISLLGPRLRDAKGRTQGSCRRRPTVGALLHRVGLLRWTGLFKKAYRRYRGRDGDLSETREVEVLMGAALFLRRRAWKRCGPWDESYLFGGEDVDFCTRMARLGRVVYHPGIAIKHLGRMSSRQHFAFAHTHTVAGVVRFLRRSGTSGVAVAGYKVAVALDAPLEWLLHLGQYGWRRLTGQRQRAAKSLLMARAYGHFFTRGLPTLWRA